MGNLADDLPPGAPSPLSQVVRDGSYRASLESLRDSLAASIDALSDRQVIHKAPLAKQLADVLATLEDLPVPDAVADSVESEQADVERILRAVQ